LKIFEFQFLFISRTPSYAKPVQIKHGVGHSFSQRCAFASHNSSFATMSILLVAAAVLAHWTGCLCWK